VSQTAWDASAGNVRYGYETRGTCRIHSGIRALYGRERLAPRDGFEPPTNGLTVRRSTTELPRNVGLKLKERDSAECSAGVSRKNSRPVKNAMTSMTALRRRDVRTMTSLEMQAPVGGAELNERTTPVVLKDHVQRWALRRLTPITIRSTRHVLVSRCRAAMAGVIPRRATRLQTCKAYCDGCLNILRMDSSRGRPVAVGTRYAPDGRRTARLPPVRWGGGALTVTTQLPVRQSHIHANEAVTTLF
jgi:hypothetical protein